MLGETHDVNVACLELLQAGFDAEKHRLCVVAGEIALDNFWVVNRDEVRRELTLSVSMLGLTMRVPNLPLSQ